MTHKSKKHTTIVVVDSHPNNHYVPPPPPPVPTPTIVYNGIFTIGFLNTNANDPNNGINVPGITTTAAYTIGQLGNRYTLTIAPFTITTNQPTTIIVQNGFIPTQYAYAGARFVNFPVIGSNSTVPIIGHVFRDGTVRFSTTQNGFLPIGTYSIPQITVSYSSLKNTVPTKANFAIAQGLTNATVNQGIFPGTPSVCLNEWFTLRLENDPTTNQDVLTVAWNDNSPEIKAQSPNPDIYTDIAFARLDINGNYIVSPVNVTANVPGTNSGPFMAINPSNPNIINFTCWSLSQFDNFESIQGYTTDGGHTWTITPLYADEYLGVLQSGSIDGDHRMEYEKFGTLIRATLPGYYNSMPFNQTNVNNLAPLLSIETSPDAGQTWYNTFLSQPLHSEAFGLDYPLVCVSNEADGTSVFNALVKPVSDQLESFETADTYNVQWVSIKFNGLNQIVGIKQSEVPKSQCGGYGEVTAGKAGLGADLITLGITVLQQYGVLRKSNGAIWFSRNPIGYNGFFQPIVFNANTNSGFRETPPPTATRELFSQPNVAIDLNGRIYQVYVDKPATIVQPTNALDIWMIYSDDNGVTWSLPYKVNDDNTPNTHLQPQIRVSRTTNNVAVAWYDSRNDPASTSVQTYGVVYPNGYFPPVTYGTRSAPPETFFDIGGDIVNAVTGAIAQ